MTFAPDIDDRPDPIDEAEEALVRWLDEHDNEIPTTTTGAEQ